MELKPDTRRGFWLQLACALFELIEARSERYRLLTAALRQRGR